MRKIYLLPLAGIFLGLEAGTGCKEKSPQVVAPNTLALNLNGNAFAVDIAASSLVVDPATQTIVITAKGQDGITQIRFSGHSSNSKGVFAAQKFNPTSQGGASGETAAQYLSVYNNVYSCLGRTLNGIETYESTLCNHPDNAVIDLQAVDQSARTMSGTFSGTCCKNGNPCDDKVITNGRFSLTY